MIAQIWQTVIDDDWWEKTSVGETSLGFTRSGAPAEIKQTFGVDILDKSNCLVFDVSSTIGFDAESQGGHRIYYLF